MPAYGRGGAGNIQAVEKEDAKVSADLEANQPASNSSEKASLPVDYLQKHEPQYVNAGRGGAGNYYSPKELDRTEISASRSSAAATGSAPISKSLRTPGRGGAGNYEFGAQQSDGDAVRKRNEEQQTREKLKQGVERGVMEQLAAPPKAKLAGGESF